MKKWKGCLSILLIAMLVLPMVVPTGVTVAQAEEKQEASVKGGNRNASVENFLSKIGASNYTYNEGLNTITLQKNVSIRGQVELKEISNTLTLDLNGKTMTLLPENDSSQEVGFHVEFDADFAITNSGVIKSDYKSDIVYVHGGDFRIVKSENPVAAEQGYTPGVPRFDLSGRYSAGSSSQAYAIRVLNEKYPNNSLKRSPNVYIEDVYISYEGGNGLDFTGGAVQIDNATISTVGKAVHNGATSSKDELKINNGTYISRQEEALEIRDDSGLGSEYGSTVLNGGTFTGYTDGIYSDYGKLCITGPTTINTTNGDADANGISLYRGMLVLTDTQSVISGNQNGIFAKESNIYIAGGNITGGISGIDVWDCVLDIQGGVIQGSVNDDGPLYKAGVKASDNCDVYISGGAITGKYGLLARNSDTAKGPKVTVCDGTFTGRVQGYFMENCVLDMTSGTVRGTEEEGAYLYNTDMYLKGGDFKGGNNYPSIRVNSAIDNGTKVYLLLGEDGENHIELNAPDRPQKGFSASNEDYFDIIQISSKVTNATWCKIEDSSWGEEPLRQVDDDYMISHYSNAGSALQYPNPEATKYHVTYENVEGTFGNERNPQYVEAGKRYTLYDVYKEDEYFAGWYKDAGFYNQFTDFSTITSDITLYAKFTPNDSNHKKVTQISYEHVKTKYINETTPFDLDVKILAGNTQDPIIYALEENNIVKITDNGKLQLTGKEGTTKVSGCVPGNAYYYSTNFVIELRVTKPAVKPVQVRYNIKFNNNGNKFKEGIFSSITNCLYEQTYKLPKTATTKKGYALTWNTRADGKGTSYKAGASVKGLTKTNGATVTLYAVWKKVNYTITYKLNGGTNVKSNPKNYTVTSKTITLKSPKRKGYTFAGWYKNKKCTSRVKKIAKGSTGNRTLYAKWTANKYTVKFYGNGSTKGKMKNQSFTYDAKKKALRTNTFKRTGYKFVGWNTKANGKGKTYKNKAAVKNLTYKSKGTVKLYAQWKKVKK